MGGVALKNHSPNPFGENMRDATFPGMGVCMLPVVHGAAKMASERVCGMGEEN